LTFVDTNVIMYAVGRDHPLKATARAVFEEAIVGHTATLCTSSEVLQELLLAYLPVKRMATLDAALQLAKECLAEVWAMEVDDVILARALAESFPGLDARDLLHLASCRRRGVQEIISFDRAFDAAFHRLSHS